jgi:hypothetical protein
VFTSVNPSPFASLISPLSTATALPATSTPTLPTLSSLAPHEQLAAIKAMRSTRTKLTGARPLVRTFARTELPDDFVPPYLAFAELEALHHRLVVRGGRAGERGLAFVKWVCSAYEGWLRRRRERVTGVKERQEGKGKKSNLD